nr:radical SAM family heme chaperone HemW [Rickettsiella massiliensis]
MGSMLTLPPLSLYIHFPWCIRKCPYCDFNSHPLRSELPEKEYIHALLRDLEDKLPQVHDRPLHSIFMGGGTPSLFSAESIAYLLAELKKRLFFTENIEITLEANPGTTEYLRFQGYRDAGVNRLSIGVQSFEEEQLKRLGRIHDRDQAYQAIEQAQTAGFPLINIDLMYGLPNQSVEAALADLRQYQLTLEPNTEFARQPPPLPADDQIAVLHEQGIKWLNAAGYEHYEISAYSRPHAACRHNRNYWEFGDYIGIGAGAHSKLSDETTQRIVRSWNCKQPHQYLMKETCFIAEEKIHSHG